MMRKIEKPMRRARVLLHDLLASERGSQLRPVRAVRQALSFVNDLAGRPLCSAEELRRRDQAVAEAEAALRARAGAALVREAAPVVVYTSDQDHRTPRRIADILKARDIPFTVNDVTDDEATRSWVLTQARAQELPQVFIAGEPIGGLEELMQLDLRGALTKKVFG